MKGRCFTCGEKKHGAKDCEVDLLGACSENGSCHACMLPSEVIGEHNYHAEKHSYGEGCPQKDTVKLAALLLFQTPAHIAMDSMWKERNLEDFSRWLSVCPNGFESRAQMLVTSASTEKKVAR